MSTPKYAFNASTGEYIMADRIIPKDQMKAVARKGTKPKPVKKKKPTPQRPFCRSMAVHNSTTHTVRKQERSPTKTSVEWANFEPLLPLLEGHLQARKGKHAEAVLLSFLTLVSAKVELLETPKERADSEREVNDCLWKVEAILERHGWADDVLRPYLDRYRGGWLPDSFEKGI